MHKLSRQRDVWQARSAWKNKMVSNKTDQSDQNYREYATVSDAALILGVSIDTVRRWEKAGKLHAQRLDGKNRYFAVDELHKYKSMQPLSTSEVAKLLNVSQSTVRRLEEQRLLTPLRNDHGKRLYDREAVDLYLRERLYEPSINTMQNIPAQREPQVAFTHATAPALPIPVSYDDDEDVVSEPREKRRIAHKVHTSTFKFIQRLLVYSVGVALLLISLFTVMLLVSPVTMSNIFYKSSNNKGQQSRGVVARVLQPFADRALNVTDVISPDIRDKVQPVAVTNVTQLFSKDDNGNITTSAGFSPPSSSYLKIPDSNLVVNLNSDYVQGQKPGSSAGDLALLPITSSSIKDGTITADDIAAGGISLNNLSSEVLAYIGTNQQQPVIQPVPFNGINGIIAGAGLTGGGTSGTPTITLQTGHSTQILSNAVEVRLGTSATATMASVSGLEVTTTGLQLIGGCGVNQLLKWSGTDWACAPDIAGGGSFDVQEGGLTVTSPVAAINFNASDFSVTDNIGQASITIDYANSGITRRNQNETIAGTWTFANANFNTITATSFNGNLTGNVNGSLSGNATTATALASNPTDCGANTFATAIAANGNLTCTSVTKSALANSGVLGFAWSDSEVSDTLTIGAGGSVADSALSTNVTKQGNTFNGNSQLIQATAGGLYPALNGSLITNINATQLNGQSGSYYLDLGNATGTLAIARIADGSLTSAKLTNSSLIVNPGTGLTGGGSVVLGASTTLNLANTTVTPNTYGSASSVSTFTVDQQGRLTGAASVPISINGTNIANDSVALGTQTTGNYVSALGSLTGLSVLGNSGEGSTPSLSVTYGSATNTSVQGNVQITCPTGIGNLTGGGNTITLGAGGSCNAISTNSAVSFATSVTTPSITNAGPLSVTATGASHDLTLGAGGSIILSGFDCTGFLNGGVLTVDASGHLTCDNDDGGAGGSLSGSGSTDRLPIYTGTTSLGTSWLAQTGSTLQLDNTRNLQLLGGNITVNGDVTATNFTGDGSGVTNVDALTLGGQAGSYYLDLANATGTLAIARIADGSLTNAKLQNSSVSVSLGTNLSGSSSVALGGTLSVNVSATPTFTSVSATTLNGDLTGNVLGDVTGSLIGNADTATALAANPTDCAANQFANAIDANGNLTCADLTDTDIPDALTVGAGATVADGALSSNVTVQGNTFNGAGQLVQLDGSGFLPALNGSALTSVDAVTLSGQNGAYYSDLSNATGTLAIARIADGSLTNAKLVNSSVTVTAGNGLTNGGSVALGGSVSLAVAYGSSANTAVQGNTQLTVTAGTNLSGGGTITLGSGGTVTLNTTVNPTFSTSVTTPLLTNAANLTLSSTGTGNDVVITTADKLVLTGFNCTSFDNGGVLTVNAAGEVVCDNDDGGAAGTITGSGSTNRIPLYTGAQSLGSSWLAQTSSTLQLDNTRDLSLLGGNVTVNGDVTANTFSGDGSSLANVNAATLNGQAGTYYLDLGNATGTLNIARIADSSISNVKLANSSISTSFGTNLSGSSSVALGGTLGVNITATPTFTSVDATTFTGDLNGNVTGNADTATALAADPTDCSANQFANAISTSGDLSCATVGKSALSGSGTLGFTWGDSEISDTLTIGATSVIADGALSSNITKLGNAFNGASQLVQLDAGGLLPVLDGSALTNVDAVNLGGQSGAYYQDLANATGTLNIARIADSSITNLKLANSSISTSFGTNLSGSSSVALGGTLSVNVSATPSFTSVSATTFTGSLSGNASTATALAADPADCSANQFANAIDAGGNLNCAGVTDADVSDTLTASIFKGSGSTTNAVDLGTAEVAGTLGVTNGGTGITSYTAGDLIFASGATSLSKLPGVAVGSCLISAGVGVAPQWGSCAAGGGITGSGTANSLPMFTSTGVLGDSWLSQMGSTLQLASGKDLTLISGNVTASTFTGALSGNATTATSLAANPSDCAADTYATAIAANGNLSCASITDAALSANVTKLGATLTKDEITNSGVLGFTWTDSEVSDTLTIGSASTVADGALSANVTLAGNTFNGNSQLVQTTAGGLLPALDGSLVTNVDALTLGGQAVSYYLDLANATGTLAIARIADGSLTNAKLQNSSVSVSLGANLSGSSSVALGGTLSVNVSATPTFTSVSATTLNGDLTGNVLGDVTGSLIGNADTATALAANPTDCAANQFANAIGASGNLSCSSVSKTALANSGTLGFTWIDSEVSDALTISASGSVADGALSATVTKLGSTIDLATNEVSGNLKASSLQNAATDLGAANVTIDLSNSNGSFVTNLITDGTITATTFSGNLTGNVTGVLTGNASTATALAANPTDCSTNQFANAIAANGNLTCAAITDADVPDSITVDLATAATALAADPSDCAANSFATTIAASGNLSCVALTVNNLPTAAANLGAADVNLNFSNTNGSFNTNLTLDGVITASSFSGALTGNASTASALAADPSDCTVNQFATVIAANGNLSCAALTDADIPNTITINLAAAATALQADPSDCAANTFATSIVASGNLGCTSITDADVPNTITINLAAAATALAADPSDCAANSFATTIAASGNLSCSSVGKTALGNSGTLAFTWSDAEVADTLTASIFIGSGSTTNAIDLATAEVNGTLPVANGGTGATTLSDLITLGAHTTGNYVATLGTLTGLSTSGNTGEGSTPTLTVLYGSTANTAVQGNTTFTCPSGTGNLTGGGGGAQALGGGISCGNISTNNAVTFTTSVTTPLLQNAGLTVAATGANSIVFQTNGSTRLTIASSGAATFANSLTVSSGGASISGGLNNNSGGITNAGAISGATTIAASGAVTGGTYNGQTISSTASFTGSLNAVSYKVGGTNGTSVTCTNNDYLKAIVVVSGIMTGQGGCAGIGLSDERVKTNITDLDDDILSKLKDVHAVNFEFDCSNPVFAANDLSCETGQQSGVIAQELATVFPELVYQGEDGLYRVKYDQLNIYNLKATTEIANYIDQNQADKHDIDLRIDGLDSRIASLEQDVADLQQSSGQGGQDIDLQDLQVGQLTVSLDLLVSGGLTVNGPAEFKGTALFDQLVTFNNSVAINGDLNILGTATFNNNAGGYATINVGQQSVHVSFSAPYAQQPIVNLTLGHGKFAQYSYDNVTVNGFDIVLNSPASEQLEFSWTATSIANPLSFVQP